MKEEGSLNNYRFGEKVELLNRKSDELKSSSQISRESFGCKSKKRREGSRGEIVNGEMRWLE